MALLERSVLSESDIRMILAERYQMREVGAVTSMEGGSANCFLITSSQGQSVLKEFQSGYSLADIAHEPDLTEFVRTHGIQATRFVPATTGEYVWEYRGRAFHLQGLVEGVVYPLNEAPEWLLRESAILLGRLHQALLGYPRLKEEMTAGWFSWDSAAKRHQYSDLISAAEKLAESEVRDRILVDLRYKMGLISGVGNISIDPDRLTRRNTHGDYHIGQMVCGPESVRAILDFSGACHQPSIWEIIRSYTYADPACADGSIDTENLKCYTALYLENDSLSRYDLEMMPCLYLFQLARSVYGYSQYLSTGAVNPEQLIRFASWRTNMCRWLEENADTLLRELGTLLK